MKYFNLLPMIEYGGVIITNLFYRYIIDTPIDQEFLFDYKMMYGESLEDIALKTYDNTRLWWVIAIVNNIKDPFFDILVDDDIIRENARDKATTNLILDHEKFIEIYDILSTENENKRDIKLLSKEYLNTFLSDAVAISARNAESIQPIDEFQYELLDESIYLEFLKNDEVTLDENGNKV